MLFLPVSQKLMPVTWGCCGGCVSMTTVSGEEEALVIPARLGGRGRHVVGAISPPAARERERPVAILVGRPSSRTGCCSRRCTS